MKQQRQRPNLGRIEREERLKVRNGMYQPAERKYRKAGYTVMWVLLIVLIIFGIYSYSLL